MQPETLPDITGDGAAHPLSATSQKAKWVQIVAITVASTSAPIRVGGTATSGSQGAPLFVQGASQFFPQDTADIASRYDLNTMFYDAASGDKFAVLYCV